MIKAILHRDKEARRKPENQVGLEKGKSFLCVSVPLWLRIKKVFYHGDTEAQRKPKNQACLKTKRSIYLCVSVSLWLSLFFSGCAPVGYEIRNTGVQASPEEAIRDAEAYLKTRPNWKIDCSHFVLACYHSPEMDRFFGKYGYLNHNLTKDLRIYLEQKGTRRARAADIQPGDILIFNKTYDRNGDGRIDDKDTDTHTALVEGFKDMVVTYIDASEGRKPPRIHRRTFSFFGKGHNETVATDPATGHKIHARDTFYAAYGPPEP